MTVKISNFPRFSSEDITQGEFTSVLNDFVDSLNNALQKAQPRSDVVKSRTHTGSFKHVSDNTVEVPFKQELKLGKQGLQDIREVRIQQLTASQGVMSDGLGGGAVIAIQLPIFPVDLGEPVDKGPFQLFWVVETDGISVTITSDYNKGVAGRGIVLDGDDAVFYDYKIIVEGS